MKHIILLLIITSYPLFSDSAGSCNNAVLKQCMDFVTGAVSSEAKSACEKVRGTYSSGTVCGRNYSY